MMTMLTTARASMLMPRSPGPGGAGKEPVGRLDGHPPGRAGVAPAASSRPDSGITENVLENMVLGKGPTKKATICFTLVDFLAGSIRRNTLSLLRPTAAFP